MKMFTAAIVFLALISTSAKGDDNTNLEKKVDTILKQFDKFKKQVKAIKGSNKALQEGVETLQEGVETLQEGNYLLKEKVESLEESIKGLNDWLTQDEPLVSDNVCDNYVTKGLEFLNVDCVDLLQSATDVTDEFMGDLVKTYNGNVSLP